MESASGQIREIFRSVQVPVSPSNIMDERAAYMQAAFAEGVRDGHVYFVYQPIVEPKTGACRAVEVLARWEDDALGSISPAEFVPALANSPMIHLLSEASISTALEQYTVWREKGIAPEYIAVNVSPEQIREPGFSKRVLQILRERGLPPRVLCIEIMEGQRIRNIRSCRNEIHELSEDGVHIAMDDFGSGHSGLLRLSELPIDILKLDRIRGSRYLRNDFTMWRLQVFVDNMRLKGIGVIAEGIEEMMHAERMGKVGVKAIQGYCYSRPLDTDAILMYLQEHGTTGAFLEGAGSQGPDSVREQA